MITASNDYVIRVHEDPREIDAAAWNALLARQTHPTPFMRHEYLAALHASGSATGATGWQAQFLSIEREGVLIAACPLYIKRHSYGEYVFDWAWADAYQRHGLRYYPKLLVAVPFTPVAGTRLLAVDEAARTALLEGLSQFAAQAQLSSAHILFPSAQDLALIQSKDWLLRRGVQFHWNNRPVQPYGSFDDFLSTLQRDKRKKIAQERRYVLEAGVTFEVFEGSQIGSAQWDFFYHCYQLTYAAHRSTPYLTREFFAAMAGTMPEHWLMFVARRAGQPVAASLVGIDRARGQAYGRYWGSVEQIRCLHFEACYYQPLQWLIDQGFLSFEGGAQGEHKMWRGLLPVVTHSAHRLSHPGFAQAIDEFLAQEGQAMAEYVNELGERNPFRPDPAVKA
jgi:hypothetical protein